MKLNKSQILVISGIIVLTAILYMLPKKVLINEKQEANRDKPQSEKTENKEPDSKSIETILEESLSSLTDAQKQGTMVDENSSPEVLNKAMEAFRALNNKLGIAFCMDRLGNFTEKEVGMAYYDAYNQSQIDENKAVIASKVIGKIQPLVEQNPTDLEAKCALADCLVNSTQMPMNGIQLLQQVLNADSTHEEALFLMARFAVKSGQMERAVTRFQSLVRHYPSNIKYSLYLAQLFSDRGDGAKALEILSEAKKYTVRQSAIDSINNSIKHLK